MGFKRITFGGFVGFLLLLSSLSSPQTLISAEKSENATLSDLIYAELAIKNQLYKVSVNYFDGNSDNNISINSEKQWIPASTIKIYAAMYAYNEASLGKINLNDEVVISGKNIAPSEQVTDPLPDLEEGESVTIYHLLQQMIVQSDNTAFNTLLDVLDRREITKYVHDLGLTNTNIAAKLNLDDNQQQYEYSTSGYGSNTTTSDDYARAFILISGNRIPGSSGLFTILAQQKINNMIPLLLPKDVTVAHKTGDLSPLYHDGGIVETADRKYILSIFSNIGDPNVIAHLSQLIFTRDVSLVGAEIHVSTTSDNDWPSNQALDPVLSQSETGSLVLADSNTNLVPLPITAADLGVKLSDVTFTIPSDKLPKVVIPSDSPWHFLVNFWEKITTPLIIGKSSQMAFRVQGLKLELAEAQDLSQKGKHLEAQALLVDVDKSLREAAQDPVIQNFQNLQTNIQQISETRFSLMTKELESTNNTDEKVLIIKKIAQEARAAIKEIEPRVPQAVTAANINQKPVVGQIVATTSSGVTVKTATGENINVTNESEIKIRQQGKDETITALPSTIPVGTTIALIGTNNNGTFVPSFVMTKLPARYAAALPATVIKVNEKDKTIVVSENGDVTQIDVNKDTKIKGSDTGVSFSDIKPGDVIVVHGESTPPASQTTSGNSNNSSNNANNNNNDKKPEVVKSTVIQVVGKNSKEEKKPEPQKEEKVKDKDKK